VEDLVQQDCHFPWHSITSSSGLMRWLSIPCPKRPAVDTHVITVPLLSDRLCIPGLQSTTLVATSAEATQSHMAVWTSHVTKSRAHVCIKRRALRYRQQSLCEREWLFRAQSGPIPRPITIPIHAKQVAYTSCSHAVVYVSCATAGAGQQPQQKGLGKEGDRWWYHIVKTRLTEEGVDGSDASHGMLDARPAGTLTRLTGVGVECSGASHGMFDARTAGTFTRLTLCSGAIHISDEAPLLKKLSYTGSFPCKSPSFPFLLVGC